MIRTLQAISRYWILIVLAVGFYVGWEHYGNAWTTPLLYLGVMVVGWFYYAWKKRKAFKADGRTPPNPFRLLWLSFLDGYRYVHLLRKWDLACRSEKVVSGRDKAVPWLRRIRFTPDSDTASAFVKPSSLGLAIADVVASQARIGEILGVRDMVVRPGDKVGVALMKFYWADPLGRLLPIRDMPVARQPGTVAYGVRRDGSAATLDLNKSFLTGGLTGTGKSSILWAILADLIRQQIPVVLWVSDPKGGMELDALERMVGKLGGTFRIERYSTNSKDTLKMVQDFEKLMRTRQADMKAAGIRKHVPTMEHPHMLLVLDELLPLHAMIRKGTEGELGAILFEGRAAGFTVGANAQIGHAAVLGELRNLIPQRLCLGMPTPQSTDTILGQGAEQQGAICSELGKDVKRNAGLGFSVDENGKLAKFRAAYVSDADTPTVAAGLILDGMVTADTPHATTKAEPVFVYRRYDLSGRLLYVGITNRPYDSQGRFAHPKFGSKGRFAQHRREDFTTDCPICEAPCKWWEKHVTPFEHDPQCAPDAVPYPDRATALKVEEAAIKNELPLFNRVHNGGNPLVRRARALFVGHRDRRFAARVAVPVDPERLIEPVAEPQAAQDELAAPAASRRPRRRPAAPESPTEPRELAEIHWGAE